VQPHPPKSATVSAAVFTANHLTDTDKQNSTGKYKQETTIAAVAARECGKCRVVSVLM